MSGANDATIEDCLILYHRAMLAYAYACANDFDVAKDLTEQSQQLAREHADEREPETEIGDWLLALIYHCWCTYRDEHVGSPSAERPLLHEGSGILFVPEFYPDADQQTELAIGNALARLSVLEKRLLRLCFSDNQSYEATAAKTGLTPSKVKLAVNRALTTLRGELFTRRDGNA